MVRRFVYLAVLFMVATLAFAPAAVAQEGQQPDNAQYKDGQQSSDPRCTDGILDRDGDGQISPIEAAQAGADATQGGDPCSGTGGVQQDQYGTGVGQQPQQQAGDGGGQLGEIEATSACSGAGKRLGAIPKGSGVHSSAVLEFYPELGGCAIFEATPAPFGVLYTTVYDPNTGAKLGLVKDLDSDLSSGDISVTHKEFCGGFPTPSGIDGLPSGLSAQQYYDQQANSNERAILDPNGDGRACTSEDAAFLAEDTGGTPTPSQPTSGSSGECSGAAKQLEAEQPNVQEGQFESYLKFYPDLGGCVIFEGGGPNEPLGKLGTTVYDPDTGAKLGLVKDVDPDLSSGAFSVTYKEFCEAFPTTTGETAQQYYDQEANAKEQAILDPNGDGLACTADDTAFLAGDTGGTPDSQQPQQSAGQPQQPSGDGDGGQQLHPVARLGKLLKMLPDTGGPMLLIPAVGVLLVAGGVLRFAIKRRGGGLR